MHWTPLPSGLFTGIDWSRPGACDGADPYLVWAESSRFAGYGHHVPEWLPVLIEVTSGTTVADLLDRASSDWLHVPGVYAQAPAAFRFCTARVRPEFFAALRDSRLGGLVQGLELGLPGGSGDPAPQALESQPPRAVRVVRATDRAPGKVLGLIDDGFAVCHANFQLQGRPRVTYLWRQDGNGRGRCPADFGYGSELSGDEIADAMTRHTYAGLVDESAAYVELGLSTLGRHWPDGRVQFHGLDVGISHGTHVMDLAAGPLTPASRLPADPQAPPSWAPADDEASRCPIIAVQLDHASVRDTSGGSLVLHVLDGLLYILSRCRQEDHVTINLSFGNLAGPHDGSSMLERAMQQLLALRGPQLQLAVAAGNSYQLRTHGNLTLQPGQTGTLSWRIPPGDATQSFLELWIPQGCEGVQLEVVPPGHAPLPPLSIGDGGVWTDAEGRPLCALIYPRRVATGAHGTCALLAVTATSSMTAGAALAPSGVWSIRLRNTGRSLATVDAYVERDDVAIGTRSGARQSHLEDPPDLPPDQQYDMDAFVDDPQRATTVRRSGNFNSIAAACGAVSVGGRRASDGAWARYSPRRPDPDDARPERPHVVKMPAAQAISDEDMAMVGLRAAGTRSGGVVRLAGTSDAAPQVARRLLNGAP